MSAEAEVQKGIYDALTTALSPTPVYDEPPQDTEMLYVVIGQDQAAPSDTKEAFGLEHRVQIDIWSEYGGWKECKQTLDLVYAALHRKSITVAGYDSTELQFTLSDYLEDPTRGKHGVIVFTLQTVPE